MAMPELDLQGAQMFCKLPSPGISPGKEGRRWKLEGSLAGAYIAVRRLIPVRA